LYLLIVCWEVSKLQLRRNWFQSWFLESYLLPKAICKMQNARFLSKILLHKKFRFLLAGWDGMDGCFGCKIWIRTKFDKSSKRFFSFATDNFLRIWANQQESFYLFSLDFFSTPKNCSNIHCNLQQACQIFYIPFRNKKNNLTLIWNAESSFSFLQIFLLECIYWVNTLFYNFIIWFLCFGSTLNDFKWMRTISKGWH